MGLALRIDPIFSTDRISPACSELQLCGAVIFEVVEPNWDESNP
jgi:hypothetical protein